MPRMRSILGVKMLTVYLGNVDKANEKSEHRCT